MGWDGWYGFCIKGIRMGAGYEMGMGMGMGVRMGTA